VSDTVDDSLTVIVFESPVVCECVVDSVLVLFTPAFHALIPALTPALILTVNLVVDVKELVTVVVVPTWVVFEVVTELLGPGGA
jgi:hypothetical protein